MSIRETGSFCPEDEAGVADETWRRLVEAYFINRDRAVGFGNSLHEKNRYIDTSVRFRNHSLAADLAILSFPLFVKTFYEEPETYEFNCINILGVLAILTLRERLACLVGDPDKVDKFLDSCEICVRGDHTSLSIAGVKYYPLWPSKQAPPDGVAISLSPDYTVSIDVNATVEIEGLIKPGSFLIMGNHGVLGLDSYGSSDYQNGVIMEGINGSVAGDNVSFFAHQEDVSARMSTIKAEAEALLSRIPGHGLSIDEFNKRGGMTFQILEVDYGRLVRLCMEVIAPR